jgi:hypothetical protein
MDTDEDVGSVAFTTSAFSGALIGVHRWFNL